MNGEVKDETLKRYIMRRAIKNGCDRDGDLVSYGGRLYFVHCNEGRVVEQLTKK